MFAWLGRIVAAIFGTKFFMSGVMMTILGLILYNLIVEVISEALAFAVAQLGGVSAGTIASPTISGAAGYVLGAVKFPEAFGIMLTCISLKFVLRKIPFLKW